MAMTTTRTRPELNLPAIREALEVRDSAVADLMGGNPGLEWRADRIVDVAWANRLIAAEAERCGMTPAEAIRRAMA